MFCFKCGADISDRDTVCPVCGASVYQVQESGQLPPTHSAVSFRDRALSFGIDLLMLLVIWFGLSLVMYRVPFYLLTAIFVLYFTLTIGGPHAASFGQRCLKIRVVNTKTGQAPGYAKALLRALFLYLSVGVFGLGCVLFFITGESMLHDLISGTRVVHPNEK